jgi:hypothetical protein
MDRALKNSRGNRALVSWTRDRGGDEPEEVARAWGDQAARGDGGRDFQRCDKDKDAVRASTEASSDT